MLSKYLLYLVGLSVCEQSRKRYIVSLKDDANIRVSKTRSSRGFLLAEEFHEAEIEDTFQLINGYLATLSEDAYKKIKRLPQVEYIEEDKEIVSFGVQYDAPWGLSRLNSIDSLSSTSSNFSYKYHDDSGKDVNVYVLDTGVNINHEDFEGRASFGVNFTPNNEEDNNGHGTHCAGIIAGKKYGVSKKANIIAVKLLNDDSTSRISTLLSSVDFLVNHTKSNGGKKGNIVNLSLGTSYSSIINEVVEKLVGQGIVVVSAAGNSNSDACLLSPASSNFSITVGATDSTDHKASFSNYGRCVSLFAPGQYIESTYIGSEKSTKTMSGTSMAAPHAVGLAAYYMSKSKNLLTPQEVKEVLLNSSLKDVIVGEIGSGSPNNLLHNNLVYD